MTDIKKMWQDVLDSDEALFDRLRLLREKYDIPEDEIEELQHLSKRAETAYAKYWVELNKAMTWYKRAWFRMKSMVGHIVWLFVK